LISQRGRDGESADQSGDLRLSPWGKINERTTDWIPLKALVGINEELKATEAARAALSTNANSKETIRVLRQAKYIAALAMTTFASDKPLNDVRHAVVITLSEI
jgi:hypothetical protein